MSPAHQALPVRAFLESLGRDSFNSVRLAEGVNKI